MKLFFITILLLILQNNLVLSQSKQLGGPCEDCDALLDYRLLSIQPNACDTLPGFKENEPKIKITGTVFEKDGITPASNIILYIYHVDRKGVYQPSNHPIGWEKRHGQYRGWLKSNKNGKYTFFTFRPASYPSVQEPEHIHIYVKEPNMTPYYIDNILFESDALLTEEIKQTQKNRGGSGIVQLKMKNGIWTANRDIILGLNIPEYK